MQVAAVHQIEPARVPPQNEEAERNVLGAMLLAPGAVATCLEVLKRSDFYFASHGVIFEAIGLLEAENAPADAITVAAKLDSMGKLEEVGGAAKIHELVELVPASANARYHAEIVREQARLREALNAAIQIQEAVHERQGTAEEILSMAETLLTQPGLATEQTAQESVTDYYRALVERSESGVVSGLNLGLRDLDDLLEGLEPGDLMYIGARPSMGKSSIALEIAFQVARTGIPVALRTLEMSHQQVMHRYLSMLARVDGKRIKAAARGKAGRLTQDDWSRLPRAVGILEELPLLIDDRAAAFSHICSSIKRTKRKHPRLGLVVIDYLQLIESPDSENENIRIERISRSLKLLAGELGIAIICLSQLSRAVEQRHNKRPILADLRSSGAIEQDADVVMFLYRDEYYDEDSAEKGLAELIVSKHRNGPTGTVKVAWSGEYTRFSDLAVKR